MRPTECGGGWAEAQDFWPSLAKTRGKTPFGRHLTFGHLWPNQGKTPLGRDKALAALWPGVDHHRTIRGGRILRPAAAIAADARAVAFARWINTRHLNHEHDADLTIAGDERFDNGVDEAHFRGPLSDPFESLASASRLATREQRSLL